MKITVIGANSYIARNLLYYIQSVDKRVSFQLYDCQESHADGVKPYRSINVLEPASLGSVDFGCDLLFVFTGKTGSAAGFDQADTFLDINEKALLHILNEYRKQKSSAKILFPSTRLVYKGSEKPLKEDAQKEFKTVYAMNKYACEWYLRQYSEAFGIRYCVLRICVPYGTMISAAASYGTAEFMINRAKKGKNITLYGDGQARRTLTHIEDICGYMYGAALSDRCINDVFNIGGEAYSLAGMAEMIADKYKTGVEFIPYPPVEGCIESGSTVFDAVKLNNRIRYVPKHNFASWCACQEPENEQI